MTDLVRVTYNDDVGVITIHNPPVNALSPGVPEGIQSAIQDLCADPNVRAIVLIGAGQTFIAGADIREFSRIASGERPPLDFLPFLRTVEDSPKPVLAAIHGTALGGGLETAMAAHYRVIKADAKVGQPEVKLGLIPGAGGTQRLPRLVGILKAAELCAMGDPRTAGDALAIGLADGLIEGELLTEAVEFAHRVAGQPTRKTRERTDKLSAPDPAVLEGLRRRIAEARRGQRAPLMAIEAVEAAGKLSFDEGCEFEAKLFRECLSSVESKALIHAFFGERTVARIPFIAKNIEPLRIDKVAVVGAGTMGSGIATVFANAGLPVRIIENSEAALDRGMAAIRKNYERTASKGRLSPSEVETRIARIVPQLNFAGLGELDLVVEAVWENLDAKKQVFSTLDRLTRPSCILASNTSSLNLDEIASATTRPEYVIGTHFFSPANVMRLLEVVRGERTSSQVIATCTTLGKRLGKVAVLSRNGPGFIGNRVFRPYLREARFLAEEGASVEEINGALYEFGMAMGPLAVDDLTGIDVLWHIEQEFLRREQPGVRTVQALKALFDLGRYGQKTGAGWSRYDEARHPAPDPAVSTIIEEVQQRTAINRREIGRDEIVDRCILSLINEGARVLEEGIALRSVDIDIVFLNGFGFPAWRGGPMFYADTLGLDNVLAKIRAFEKRFGSGLWSPATLLVQLVNSRKNFSDWDREREGA